MTEERYAPYLSFLGLPEPARATGGPRVALLPIPYDLTTSYQPGARRGPLAILEASTHLETYDEELELDVSAAIQLETLAPVVPDTSGPAATLARIRRVAEEVLVGGAFLVGLGGEHSVTYPLVEAVHGLFPDVGVLQLDAHADLRDSFEGSPFNHACVMHRILDLGVPLAQVGIRSLTAAEHQLIRQENITTIFAHRAATAPLGEFLPAVLAALPSSVFITVDLDVFDPAIMPATGTPEPGGLSWYRVLEILRAVASSKKVVGFDVVELAPLPGFVAPDFLAAKLVYKLLGYVFSGSSSP
ncbi:MAG: agmatinase [Thermoanaerobaculum sp.]|nr:agmatinase [Thermoanaerobaculum sp.]